MTYTRQDAVLSAISKKLIEAETRIHEAQKIFEFYAASRNEESKQQRRASDLGIIGQPDGTKGEYITEPTCNE